MPHLEKDKSLSRKETPPNQIKGLTGGSASCRKLKKTDVFPGAHSNYWGRATMDTRKNGNSELDLDNIGGDSLQTD
ncbi:hypothetical protein CHS0354_013780 [Potamilus streckersoni]|uniref:Uncharacterized protein n=1 Tax=Potamilus streckersoni TaxID=2493646 RepID=A0AAE0VUX3_9BIVA|nr:hypothetical protein CHS0354_013780 [Potamilus streckersoni]